MSRVKKKSVPKSKGYRVFLSIVVICIFVSIFVTIELVTGFNENIINAENDYQWNVASINEFLKVSIPADANNIEYSGHTGRGGQLNLSFDADDEEAREFVSMLCNNTLYQNYNPFNAIDVSEPILDAHFIEIANVSYYSYSLNTPPTTYGTRCFSPIGQIQLILDTSDADKSYVELEVLFNCTKCQIP